MCAGAEWGSEYEPDEPPHAGHVKAQAPSAQRRSVQYGSASGRAKGDMAGLAGGARRGRSGLDEVIMSIGSAVLVGSAGLSFANDEGGLTDDTAAATGRRGNR
jgi:hypothetical protein